MKLTTDRDDPARIPDEAMPRETKTGKEAENYAEAMQPDAPACDLPQEENGSIAKPDLPAVPAAKTEAVLPATPDAQPASARLSKPAESKNAPDTFRKASAFARKMESDLPAESEQKPSETGNRFVQKVESVLTNRKVGWSLLALTLVFGFSTCALSGTSGTISRLEEEKSALETEKTSLEKEVDRKDLQIAELDAELEEIKNGPDAALREVKNAFEAGEYEKVSTLYADMHVKYNGSKQDQEAKTIADQANAKIEEAKEAKRKEEEDKRKAEEEEKRRQAEEEARGFETGITYEQLARTPDDFEGKKVKFYGKVVQVMYEGDAAMVRLAVNSDYNQILYCLFASDVTSSRILEDDMITVYGTSTGLYAYTSVMKQSIEIPSVLVTKIDQ